MSDQPYIYQEWPKWLYGPNGASDIFNSVEEVPPGWSDKPEGDDDEGQAEEDAAADAGTEEGRQEGLLEAPRKRGRPRKIIEDQF